MIPEGSSGTQRINKSLVQRVRNNSTAPKRATNGATGYDLSSAEDVVILGKGKVWCGPD